MKEWSAFEVFDSPVDIEKFPYLQMTCPICNAKIEATVIYEQVAPGKSRKTNRLWALLKGVA